MPLAAGLHYELHGPEHAPPVILSSGLGGSGHYWAPNLPALARSRRVILYDHRGTARSDRALPETVRVEDMADDMLAVLDALGIARADVIGHAAGGVAGLALAARAPDRVRRLVVVNGWAKADPHFLRCFAARLTLLRHAGPEAYVRAQPIFLFPADWSSSHDAELNAELPHQLAAFPGAATMEKRIAALAAFDLAALPPVTAPALVMVAKDDMLVPSGAGGRLAAALPDGQLATIETGGHACNVTQAAWFDSVVADFLGRD